MTGAFLRLGAFVLGLLGLRGVELVAPDHAPTAPLRARWLANLGFGAVNGVIVSLACASCYVLSARGEIAAYLGPLRGLGLSTWARIPLEIVFLDLVTYLLHRAYHVVPLFWRLHVVHHSDLDLDASSASRFHTGEVLVSSILKIGVVVLVGISPHGLVVFETVMLAFAQLQHANVRLPGRLESGLWWTFVPPAMHRIHHTPTREDTNSNYGTILTVWDWLFGTLRRRSPDPVASFGVEALRDPQSLGITGLLALPFTLPRHSDPERPRTSADR
jgi:sterol desaturase/sphingolipid hydroxylase (fatty acid hydroxylase superfamily)